MRISRLLTGVSGSATLAAGLALGSVANAGVINFEGGAYKNGFDLIDNSPGLAITGSALTYSVSGTSLGTDSGFVFDTGNANNTDDTDMLAPFQQVDSAGNNIGSKNYYPGNVAVIGRVENLGAGNCLNSTGGTDCNVNDTNNPGTLTFTLSGVVTFVEFKVFDVGDNPGDLAIEYFDKDNNSLGSQTVGANTSDNEYEIVGYGSPNAKIASFTFGGSGGIDDIVFREAPEPATLGVLGVGLVGLGFAARRRRKAA